jgi:acyl transferase domain-containing protein/NAD(P)H-dependent flavin oxidoreductase YrpB (nitropropane dioxygenase family)/acyl carrier protein
MPLELRQEQMSVLRELRPPFAIIAGGRPSQARELDDLGIATYLHVPSPGLLRGFLDAGARRFVFEGSECGGHTGPRSSFVLWQQAIDILLAAKLPDPGAVQVLFAGGIHDALSAAMVATMAAPLVARGMKVGVLMGTAYLFTEEIVAAGAVVDEFQRQAVACTDTALLQSGVGIYTRCARTAFCDEFDALRNQLVLEDKSEDDTLMALELLNIGRLRIASKGIARNPAPPSVSEPAPPRHIALDADTQRQQGLYMLGEVARLRDRTCTLAALHRAVALDSLALLHARQAQQAPAPAARRHEPVAIVGMAANFPGAQDLRTYWQNILRGVDTIREVSDERWPSALVFYPRRGVADKVYSKWGGFLDDIAFDPQRYGIAPASLHSIEPAQLLTLEVARQALEDAGLAQRPFPRERTACIMAVGGGTNDLGTLYNFRSMLPLYLARVTEVPEAARRQLLDTLFAQELPKWTEDSFPGILGNVVAGRVANRLDLGGSNFTVDAACAASLAALEVGFRQLRSGQADVALVGAVDCTNSISGFMCFAQTHALSPRGRSRPFDASADGIAISEGVAAVVLKRLSDAERDGDRIYALIEGIGSASDGRNRSLTAPHPPGQVAALRRAYEDAAVDPAAVTLIEAHGTGTALGDKSEVQALATVLGARGHSACALGSVKSMIGHTKVAAGLAGLIKGALALQQRVLPATIGVDQPIAPLQDAQAALYVNSELRPWLHVGRAHPRYCGVSAFGFGGTNFHAVLSEYTAGYRPGERPGWQPREVELFAFAGTTRADIDAALRRLLDGLMHAPDVDLARLGFALYREQHVLRHANGGQPCRLVVSAASVEELRRKLQLALDRADGAAMPVPGVHYRASVGAVGKVCFLFPGQGAQRVNMLRELVTGMPALHACFADDDGATTGDADADAGTLTAARIADFIYPPPVFSDAARSAQQQALNATDVAQPALGMAGLAAFDVLRSYGLHPDFTAGHSYGEYVALCAAGAITRPALLRLSLVRGRLSAQAPAGAMAALDADASIVAAAIARHDLKVAVANLNAPDQTIIAGDADLIDAALPLLAREGMRVKRLAVGTAFHCAHMDATGAALAGALASTPFAPPRVPVYSNLSAAPYPHDAAQMRALLARHIAEPVRFADEIEALYDAGARVFVECGPGLTLGGLVGRILGARPHTVLALDAPGRNGWVQLAQLLAQAESIGLPVDLGAWFAGRGLPEQSLDDVFAAAHARSEHGPLTWRVNGGRAVPWAQAAVAAPAPMPTPALLSTRRPMAAEFPPLPRRTTMSNRESAPDGALPGAAAPVAAAPALDPGTFHDALARLLAFQSEQQHSLRQFFDLQARFAGVAAPSATAAPPVLAESAAGSALPPPVPIAPLPSIALPAAVPPPRPALPPLAPVAPVLPVLPSPGALFALPAGVPVPASIISAAAPAHGNGAAHAPIYAPAAADDEPASAAQFETELLRAVAERTGYPVEMLDMDAHMEADLGIDSIKRIEIFSALTKRHRLVGERDEEQMIEELGGFKTLREVVGWYAQLLQAATAPAVGGAAAKKASAPLPQNREAELAVETDADPVRSYAVQTRRLPALAPDSVDAQARAWPAGVPVVLAGPPSALATALRERLAARGLVVQQVVPGPFTRAVDASGFEVDLSSLASAQPLADLLRSAGQMPGALVHLIGWSAAHAGADHRGDARALFTLLKVLGPDIRRSAGAGAGCLLNLSAFDGRFGLAGPSEAAPASAGALGVAKSAAREWPELRVKCIDAAPGWAPAVLAERLLAELFSADGPVEVGLDAEGRWGIGLEAHEPMAYGGVGLDILQLAPGAVVLATGGAYGITADLIRTLADHGRLHLVLLGRSALPGEEAAATRDIVAVDALRRMLQAEAQAHGSRATPVQLESELKRLLRERQIHANLAALRAAGCTVEYHALDVRDGAAFGALIDDVYARLGRIDGVLHGAGVISDKRILDKPLAAFDDVFDTKVVPALVLAAKLRMSGLRFIAFLSSVAGRFGNVGQADYSAANEVLNKLAGQLAQRWPHLHALAINWGPWDAGMVNDDLRRLYAARAIRPIPPEAGRRHFIEALARGPRGQAEIVISCSIGQIAALRADAPRPAARRDQRAHINEGGASHGIHA